MTSSHDSRTPRTAAPRQAAAHLSADAASTTGTAGATGTPGPSLAAAYGATASDSGLVPLTVARRAPKEDDVEIAVEFCGLCHSDVHATRGEWGSQNYPLVPGHEIVGRVSRVGSAVDDFTPGELVGRRLPWSIPAANATAASTAWSSTAKTA